jgi:hypothetical protein
MKRFIPFIALAALLQSCLPGDCFPDESYPILRNSTGHSIRIAPYTDGRIDSLLLLTIPPGDELNPVRTNPPNACAHPEEGESLYGSFAETCLLYDSVVVTFDSIRKSTHKRYNDSLGCAHCILFDSPRAFSNEANWVTTVISECKSRKVVTKTYTYTYTFGEEDYLNAR